MPAAPHPSISTHVLDTEQGAPARGVPVALSRWQGDAFVLLSAAQTDHDGRIPALLEGDLQPGTYQLAFDVAAYFRAQGRDVTFLSNVVIAFEIQDAARHYHVPLLLSRYACSSYRGS
jgi:5-hydroxyisourate hydrolase